MTKVKFTIKQFHEIYPDDDACLHQVFVNRYGSVKECPHCKRTTKFYKVSNRKCYACEWCSHQLHPLANTIFHKSSTSLKNWFFAIFLFSASKNGVSAKELERQLGVTYKCAYRLAMQIKKLFVDSGTTLTNIVEVDETYFGGKESNKHKNKKVANSQGRSTKAKTPIVGAVERGGKVVARVVENTNSETVVGFISEVVETGSEVNTDEYKGYAKVAKRGYIHKIIDHSKKYYYVNGVSTNTMEGFWSQLKRSIHGTYHNVSVKYLQQYVNEFAYRYNMRNSLIPVFEDVISKAWMPVI